MILLGAVEGRTADAARDRDFPAAPADANAGTGDSKVEPGADVSRLRTSSWSI